MKKRAYALAILLALSLLAHSPSGPSRAQAPQANNRYDILIRNGRIIDGTGRAAYPADVGIRDGRIARIGELTKATAVRVIDASGHIVAPGFIDTHMHADAILRRRPTATNLVRDGVTSIVTGNCGESVRDVGRWFADLERIGVSLNVSTLIGHNTIRRSVMGTENRAPTKEELARMVAMVEQAMQDGAVGLSTGLWYVPGAFAKTDEVVALARTAASHGGLYASHMRNEAERIAEAIDEAVQIGREANLPVHISHFKVLNRAFWGTSTKTIAMVEQARAKGLDVTFDQYPYTASSTSLISRTPKWAQEGGYQAFSKRAANSDARRRMIAEMRHQIADVWGWEDLSWAVIASHPKDASLNGKSIREVNRDVFKRPDTLDAQIETAIDLIAKAGRRISMVYHQINEDDVQRILAHPLTMIGRDGGVQRPGPTKPHPRSYGTAARILGRYVREKKLLTLEQAVRKLAALPAIRFGFKERGRLQEGFWADVVVFNPATVADAATFEEPHQYSRGIPYVLVNGALVVDNARHTNARPGHLLRHSAER